MTRKYIPIPSRGLSVMTLRNSRSLIGEVMAVSQEAIAYQGKSMFFKDLTFAFQNFMEGKEYTQQRFDGLNLSGIVKKHTGLNVGFILDLAEANAAAIPPVIDVNSPLTDAFRSMGLQDPAELGDVLLSFHKITSFSKDLRGSIDRANGRVTGVFSKIHTTVLVGSGLWEENNLTADEVAAVCLHEIGHIFTFFECLMQTATTNMVLASANQALAKVTSMEQRVQLVFETEQALGVDIEDKKALARRDLSPQAFNVIFIQSAMNPVLRSTAGSPTYDLRSAEFVADQFSARYGATRSLVLALDKFFSKGVLSEHRRSMGTHVAIEAFNNALRICWLVLMPAFAVPVYAVLLLIFLVFIRNENHIYDLPAERLTRLRGDLVQSMKDPKLSNKIRAQLIFDLAEIDKVLERVKDHRSLMDYLWIAVTSRRRGQFAQMRFQQEIEKLVNNDFFVKANQLKNLTSAGER